MERKSLFADEKIDGIYTNYYDFIEKNCDEKIQQFLNNIDLSITQDFEIIRVYVDYKEREILKLQIKQMFFSALGISKKGAENYIKDNIRLEKLLEDREDYFENFALKVDLDILKNSLIYSFKTYYKIASNSPERQQYYLDIYATYKTMLTSIIHMLPSSYRKELFETNYFNTLKKDLENLDYYDDFTTGYATAFNIKKFDSILRRYIEENFDIDLYDYGNAPSLKRKRI